MKNYFLKNKVLVFISLIFLFSYKNYSSTISDMNSKIKNIDKQIKQKNARVKSINVETEKLKNKINKLEKEIIHDENEKNRIMEEITVVKKNIDYGEKNLVVVKSEKDKKNLEYTAKILAWDKYAKIFEGNLPEKILLRKHYRDILSGDLNRMDYIANVQGNIKEVKENIEKEKIKLDKLNTELNINLKNLDKKKKDHANLISKLNIEKKNHLSNIEKLKKEKIRISKEIERIIRENAKKKTSSKKPIINISDAEAYKKIGKTTKPLNGKIVVTFKEKKGGVVESNGIEILGKIGSNIIASKSGTVIYADKFQGLGKVVMIDYGNNIIGVYGNLINIKVKLNQKITEGQSIGSLGLSSDGKPYLYYELRANLRVIDPIPSFK